MAENWYMIYFAGTSCGPGDHELLRSTTTNVLTYKSLDTTGDTWSHSESARVIAPDPGGLWEARFYAWSTGTGLGTRAIRVKVNHRDSACNILAELLNQDITIAYGGSAQWYSTTDIIRGPLTLAAGDVITLELYGLNSATYTYYVYYDYMTGDPLIWINSRLVTPNALVVKPWWYYQRNAMRRAS